MGISFLLFSYVSITKGGQSNQLQIIIHQLCWLGIKQVVYLACSKCTALFKLVLHASIFCILVAFLASQWYLTFQSFSNLQRYFLNGMHINSFLRCMCISVGKATVAMCENRVPSIWFVKLYYVHIYMLQCSRTSDIWVLIG